MLLAGGAEVNPRDDRGRTPLYYALGADDPELVALLRAHGGTE
jgi:ankyrin repeat protein